MNFSRRSLLRMAGAALPLSLCNAMQEIAVPEKRVPGISAVMDGSAMVTVPAGEFQMGSTAGNPDERPIHRVAITRAFEICKYEVTQSMWETVMRSAHTKPEVETNFSHFKGANLPVESITWDDAQEFLKRLAERDPGYTYRLPTEAEWEYACGGGARKAAVAKLEDVAWYGPNAGKSTQPAGTRMPNALGLFDMLGNVAEWVQDWYGPTYYAASAKSDPKGPDTGSYRVFRGGCWFDDAHNCRAAYRGFDLPANMAYNVGFRIVRTRNS